MITDFLITAVPAFFAGCLSVFRYGQPIGFRTLSVIVLLSIATSTAAYHVFVVEFPSTEKGAAVIYAIIHTLGSWVVGCAVGVVLVQVWAMCKHVFDMAKL